LPPKQALALALAEKARRTKTKRERIQLIEQAAARESASTLPNFRDVPSLVLNQDHPLSDLYYKRAPYKIYWGGRGSAKSWGFAEALVRIAAERPVRVLCAREFQNSIKESVHELLKITIERLGLSNWFDITEQRITSRTGAVFFFKGLHNNENGIRSTEGIDICWVEEGHSVSESSWRSLLPTIRKEGRRSGSRSI
jgi:phage terminase large subunit